MEKQRHVPGAHSRFVSPEKSRTLHRPTLSRAVQDVLNDGALSSVTPTKGSTSVSLSPIVHKKDEKIRSVLRTGQLFKYSDLGDYFAAKEEDSEMSPVMLNGKAPKLRTSKAVAFPSEVDSFLPAEIFNRQVDNSPVKSQASRSPSDMTVHYSPKVAPIKLPRKNKASEQLPSIREARPRPQFPRIADDHEQQRLEESIHELDQLLSRVRNKASFRSMSVTRDVKSIVARQSVDRRTKLKSLAIY